MAFISRTIIIGVGGTGQGVIREVKKNLYRRFDETPPLVKFLSIDTDDCTIIQEPLKYSYNFEPKETFSYNIDRNKGEFLGLEPPDFDLIARNNVKSCENINKQVLDNVKKLLTGNGANGFRAAGRAFLLFDDRTVYNRFQKLVNDILLLAGVGQANVAGYSTDINAEINVHVVLSLAGGTGSGGVIDIPQILRAANPAVNLKIFGHFFLSDFFKLKPHTENRDKNTFIALSELDYYSTDGIGKLSNYYNGAYYQVSNKLYDNMFLIDNTTERGTTINLSEMFARMGGYLSNAICAEANVIMSSFVNSMHALFANQGKPLFYSSLAYCEFIFNREDFINYIINKTLKNELFARRETDLDVTEIVEKFIDDNNLNEGRNAAEGVLYDELIDSIYELNTQDADFSQVLFMGPVSPGQNAHKEILNLLTSFRNNLDGIIKKKINSFKNHSNNIKNSLRKLFDSNMYSVSGEQYMPELASTFNTYFSEMKSVLEDEISKHESDLEELASKTLPALSKSINLKNIKGGLFGQGKQQRQADLIRRFKTLVEGLGSAGEPTLARLIMEIKRKREAVDIFADLINIIDEYYFEEVTEDENVIVKGKSVNFIQKLKTLKQELDKNLLYFKPQHGNNEKVFLEFYIKEFLDKNPEKESKVLSHNIINLHQEIVDKTRKKTDEQTWQSVINDLAVFVKNNLNPNDFLSRLYKREQFTIDQIFMEVFGNYSLIANPNDPNVIQLQAINQLSSGVAFLWKHHNCPEELRDSQLNVSPAMQPVKHVVISVYDTDNNIFSQGGYSLQGYDNVDIIAGGDPDKIVLLGQETAIPAFKLTNIEQYAQANRNNQTNQFTDIRLEDIPFIIPERVDENAMTHWAFAWLFGIIKREDERVKVLVTTDFSTKPNTPPVLGNTCDYFKVKAQNPANFEICYRKYSMDYDLISDVKKQVEAKLKQDPDGTKNQIEQWINDDRISSKEIRGKNKTSMTQNELRIINQEKKAIIDYFAELNRSDGQKKIRYDDANQKVVVY